MSRAAAAALCAQLHVGSELKTILTGTLILPELANDDIDDAKMPSGSKCTCEQANWKPFFEQAAKGSWGALKTVLEALVESAKQKWA